MRFVPLLKQLKERFYYLFVSGFILQFHQNQVY